ncbi:MAG TPA: SMC-Scp complex subunit ScpB [Sphingobacteriaceae bacterium]|nr:SMC-Scp complex subunit ScpB [Sphingobacteriaceae bacterium]
MENITLQIEALVFASEQGISPDEIQQLIQTTLGNPIEQDTIVRAIDDIKIKYDNPDFAISLVNLNGGYQFLTKKIHHPIISQLQILRSKKKLSRSSLETLAIIAYKQPITKLEIEQIRGVNCDYTVQKLLEKELITITGKSETVGRPILYGTSQPFADYFGINSIADLPQLKEVNEEVNKIGDEYE